MAARLTAIGSNLTRMFTAGLIVAACSGETVSPQRPPAAPRDSALSFVNKVWRVSRSSSVASGSLYVFLSDGTLVMSAPRSKPAFGTWKYGAGRLTMVEDGIAYKVDVIKQTEDEFVIISNNPGQAVEITLVPAGPPPAPK